MDRKAFTDALAAQLRAERAAADISQLELSSRTGISLSTIQRYERGSREIPMPVFAAIVAALGADSVRVFTEALNRLD